MQSEKNYVNWEKKLKLFGLSVTMTHLEKVPYPLPENYDKYLGMPYSTIPCPDGRCGITL